ncbi:hypothetical protein H0X06_06270 [Candidatus Dependentiae bacterium]|nr:hypothetical protein [Candidatus Dependentiae bacterium]
MNTKKDLSRITIDIPTEDHKKLKALAAILGKSMREIIMESIEKHLYSSKAPNKKTCKVIADAQKGKGLTTAKDAEDLFKKLGI